MFKKTKKDATIREFERFLKVRKVEEPRIRDLARFASYDVDDGCPSACTNLSKCHSYGIQKGWFRGEDKSYRLAFARCKAGTSHLDPTKAAPISEAVIESFEKQVRNLAIGLVSCGHRMDSHIAPNEPKKKSQVSD